MSDPLTNRANERKIYEEVVNLIIDYVSKEFNNDGQARLRIYSLIAQNFEGMVQSFTAPNKNLEVQHGVEEEHE